MNVNQCMKFKTKTEMLTANFCDIMLANEQGNIISSWAIPVATEAFERRVGTMETEFHHFSALSTETIIFFCLFGFHFDCWRHVLLLEKIESTVFESTSSCRVIELVDMELQLLSVKKIYDTQQFFGSETPSASS